MAASFRRQALRQHALRATTSNRTVDKLSTTALAGYPIHIATSHTQIGNRRELYVHLKMTRSAHFNLLSKLTLREGLNALLLMDLREFHMVASRAMP